MTHTLQDCVREITYREAMLEDEIGYEEMEEILDYMEYIDRFTKNVDAELS